MVTSFESLKPPRHVSTKVHEGAASLARDGQPLDLQKLFTLPNASQEQIIDIRSSEKDLVK